MFDQVSSELGTPDRLQAFATGLYLDPCPPGLQSTGFGGMDVRPVRPSVGEVSPGDRLPPEFRDLPARPLVYLTLGTVFNDSELVGGVLDAIQDLPISIAVTTGPAVDPSVLGPRPANVAAAPFVPQALLMPLASAVVSHAGSGTMLGALASGLPQVCLPRGADQFANAERVQSVGAGVRLLPDEVTPERLRAVVSQVLDEPAYERAARAMKAEIEAMPPAAEVLDDLVHLAGPSAGSPDRRRRRTAEAQVDDLGFRGWRCRESNPGPPSLHVGFSVRSPLCLYSDPPVMRTSRCDDPSRCLVFPSTPRPGGRVSPLADAGVRGGDAPGPTDHYSLSPRGRKRPGQCDCCRHLFFCDTWLTRSSSPSSARFPTIDIRSRNRSPPCAAPAAAAPG